MTLKRPITGPIEPCTERQQNARDIDERSTVDASRLRQFDQFSRLDAEQTCDDEQFGDGAGSLVLVDHWEPSDYCCERRQAPRLATFSGFSPSCVGRLEPPIAT